MPHPGAYRGNKRQKELKRLQKREDKKQKKILKKSGAGEPENFEEVGTAESIPAPSPDHADGTPPAPESEAP